MEKTPLVNREYLGFSGVALVDLVTTGKQSPKYTKLTLTTCAGESSLLLA
jgi:hypothetical protein